MKTEFERLVGGYVDRTIREFLYPPFRLFTHLWAVTWCPWCGANGDHECPPFDHSKMRGLVAFIEAEA